MTTVRTSGSRFIDTDNRHIILHGISMVSKDKERNYIGDWTPEDFTKLEQWGFNVIRLGIIWDGIEPEPGRYDDQYLESIRHWIRLANQHGMYVFLDMHQDLYSCLYSDGAPAWATMTDGHVYEKTALWSDAYLFDRAVQTAFDHFWNNSPAPDGIGIQDHFIEAWKHTVRRLGDEPNLIGYDIINEPFIGSDVQHIVQAMFTAYGELASRLTGSQPPAMEELLDMWHDQDKKMEALSMLGSIDAYRQVMEASASAQGDFERNVLSPFYQKVGDAIRECDPDGILFLETNYFSNMGVPSTITPVQDQGGRQDRQQAYAPHGYDLVTDSDYVHAADNERVSYIFQQHEATRQRLDMPMLIGEWGAYGSSSEAENAALHVQSIFEQLLCSDVFWCYWSSDIDRYSSFNGVCRAYPMAVSGTITRYAYRHKEDSFCMEWEENSELSAPTLIYMPPHPEHSPHERSVRLVPADSGFEWTRLGTSGAAILRIAPSSVGGARTVTIG